MNILCKTRFHLIRRKPGLALDLTEIYFSCLTTISNFTPRASVSVALGVQKFDLTNTSSVTSVVSVNRSKTNTNPRLLGTRKDYYRSPDVTQRRHYAQARKPVTFDYSGDVHRQADLDDKELFFPFKGVEDAIADLPDDIKKSMTIEFTDGQQKLAHRYWNIRERFLKICKMGDKYEMNIARMTIQIRNLKEHCIQFKKDKKNKVLLVEKIQMRKKLLKRLRREDYERFSWLLKELQIQYIVPPVYHGYESKRAKARRLVREEAINLTREKMAQVYERLEKEKLDFLEEKKEILARVRDDIKAYGLDETEIEYNVEIKRRNRIEERKNLLTPPPNTFQYLVYLRKQKTKAEDEARLKKALLRKKREEEAALEKETGKGEAQSVST